MKKSSRVVLSRRAVLARAERSLVAKGRRLVAVRAGRVKSERFVVLTADGKIEREFARGLAEVAEALDLLRPWESFGKGAR